jgi:RNA polymerase primary sigma factor
MKKLVITQKITSRESDSFKRYLQEISKIDLLTKEQEKIIGAKAAEGDKESIDRLITHNLRFVVSVAKQYSTNDIKLEDLVNEGNIGLQIAAERFDPSAGVKFISYAVWWVRRNILEHISKNSRAIRVPGNKVTNLNKLKKKIGELEQKLERQPAESEIIEAMSNDFDSDQVELMLDINGTVISSLDKSMDDDGFSLMDVTPNSSKPSDHITTKEDIEYNIETLLSQLTMSQRYVIESLYGLNDGERMTLAETGDNLGVSRERIRQMRDQSISILRSKADKLDLRYMIEKM